MKFIRRDKALTECVLELKLASPCSIFFHAAVVMVLKGPEATMPP